VGCPFSPNGPELARLGLAKHVHWVRTESPADAQWTCETEGIRRLQGLAAATDALVFAVRSASAANDASAAPLRIALEPAPGGYVRAQILKRRGPAASNALLLPLQTLPHLSGVSAGNRRQVQSISGAGQEKDRSRMNVAGIPEAADVDI